MEVELGMGDMEGTVVIVRMSDTNETIRDVAKATRKSARMEVSGRGGGLVHMSTHAPVGATTNKKQPQGMITGFYLKRLIRAFALFRARTHTKECGLDDKLPYPGPPSAFSAPCR